jgi:hypothetical protein
VSEKSSGAKATKSKASSDAKTSSDAKASSDAKPAASDNKSANSDTSAADKSTDSTADKSSTDKSSESAGGKSQKETISSGDVHYGYFSSVRTPAYRKGWDDIFSKKKTAKPVSRKNSAKARNNKRSQIKPPLSLDLDINELPEDLRIALGDEIRRQTKRWRINYDKLDAAGAVRWSINCEIRR